jgi:hypothetical protein
MRPLRRNVGATCRKRSFWDGQQFAGFGHATAVLAELLHDYLFLELLDLFGQRGIAVCAFNSCSTLTYALENRQEFVDAVKPVYARFATTPKL